jgi:hypothetical protein
MSKITESLQYKDLEGLVKSDFTVDVYKSKAFDDAHAIVLSFKVKGELPAEDLEKFIEKGYKILDAEKEISSDDDGQGLYDVFVELDRSPDAVDIIDEMLDDLLNLVEFDRWNFTYYKDESSLPYSRAELLKKLPTTPEQYKQRQDLELAESVSRFIGENILDKISYDAGVVTLHRGIKQLRYQLVESEVDATKVDLSAQALRECSELDNLLFHSVLIHKADGHLVLKKNNRHLYLKVL